MIREVDMEGKGQISYAEFVSLMKECNPKKPKKVKKSQTTTQNKK